MKSLTKLIFILGFIYHLNAQNKDLKLNLDYKAEQFKGNINIDKNILVINSFKMLIAPQFGGLFNESFKYVEGITNLKMAFNDFDFGFNLGLNYKIINRFTISASYNIGILKFDNQDYNRIQGTNIKVAFNYKI